MKKPACILLAWLLGIALLPAQIFSVCNTPDTPGADNCGAGCLYCALDGYTGQTGGYTAGTAPDFCGTLHNDQWLGFLAGANSITISVTPSGCQQGDGIEIALYEDCTAPPLACTSGQTGAGAETRTISTPLTPGQPYFLMINGYAGDVCSFSVAVTPVGAIASIPVGQAPPAQGPVVVAPNRTLPYSVAAVSGASAYRWSGTGNIRINGQSAPVIIPAPAGNQVSVTFGDESGSLCVTPLNPCDTGATVCKNFSVGRMPLPPPCPSDNPPAADYCADACVICDFAQYTGSNDGYTGDTPAGFCGTVENNLWIGFIASAPAATFNLVASNCITGNGMQMALYHNCDDPPLACNASNAGGAGAPVSMTALLEPGQQYFLMVDGYAGDVCDFEVTVTPPMAIPFPTPVPSPGPIEGPSTVCPGATITYSVPALEWATGYRWQAPSGSLIQGSPSPSASAGAGSNTVQVTFGNTSGPIVVTALNACYTSDPVGKSVSVQAIPTTQLPPVTICAEDAPYTLPWGQICTNSGTYCTTLQSQWGCDSVVCQFVWIKAPIFQFLTPKAICAGDSITVCGEVFKSSGMNSAVCTSYTGCDSTVSFFLTVFNPVAQIIPNITQFCATFPATLESAASTGVKTWKSPDGAVLGTGNTLTVDQAGLYILEVVTAGGGMTCVATDTIVVQTGVSPLAMATGGMLNCNLTAIQLDGTTDIPGALFNWLGPGGFSSDEEDPVVSIPGIYILNVTNPQTSCMATTTLEVQEDVSPPVFAIYTDTLGCRWDSLFVGIPDSMGLLFAWSGPNSFNSTYAGFWISEPGLYSVTVTNQVNGCTASNMAVFSENTVQPQVSAGQVTPDQDGQGAGAIDIDVVFPGVYSVAWYLDLMLFSLSEDLSNLMAGTYTAVVTGSNGCTALLAVTVTDTIVSTTAVDILHDWDVFPNPANGLLYVQYRGNDAPETRMWLVDGLGRLVAEQRGVAAPRLTMPCAHAAPGMYILLIQTKFGAERQLIAIQR